MPGRFILSLDCEGRWGVADCIGRSELASLTDRKLRAAYESVVSLLDEYQLPATFGFVGLFAETPQDFHRLKPEIESLMSRRPEYLGAVLRGIEESGGDGWHGHWAVDLAASARTAHEIALHGITHVPWGSVERDFAKAELALHPSLSLPIRSAQTFIAPRNEVAYVDLLSGIGIEGYRAAPKHRSRARVILSEFNISQGPEKDLPPSEPLAIPAGHFVNWQHGLRRLVPMWVSRLRFEHMLDAASLNDGIAHFWLHPENIATAPRTLELLRRMIDTVARRRDAGRCEVLTQLDYVRTRVPG